MNYAHKLLPIFDALIAPFVLIAAFLLFVVRRIGLHRMHFSRLALLKVGIIPVRNHYYEPLFDEK